MDTKIVKFRPRGVLKYYVLKSLEKKPLHGYKIIEYVKSISGFWTPSPGTLYPLLSTMREEGLLGMHTEGRRNVYTLTKRGMEELKKFEHTEKMIRTSLARMLSEVTDIPMKGWEELLKRRKWKFLSLLLSVEKSGMKDEMKDIGELVVQAVSDGNKEEVKRILEQTKKRLLKLVNKGARKGSRKVR